MKWFPIIHLFFVAFLALFPDRLSGQDVEAGKVIVKLKDDAVHGFDTRLSALNRAASDTSVLGIGIKSFDRINRRYGATNMRRVFPDAGKYETKHRKYGLHLWYEISINEGEDPEKAAEEYKNDENVQISEPQYKIRRASTHASPVSVNTIPDDPYFNRQWNFHNTGQTNGTPGVDIKLTDAWERIRTLGGNNRSVTVAVMDDGIFYSHADLKSSMWINEAELNGIRNVDDDGNGYRDDIYGYNFVSRSGTISPESHGTHVAGVIAAVTGNGTGVAGIAGEADIKIMSVQILEGDYSALSNGPAYIYAADNGAVISQNSWSYIEPKVSQSDRDAINYFISEAGRDENGNPRQGTPMVGGIVIFAADNDGSDALCYPAALDNVLAVAAVNHYGKLAYYSNYGNWVDISAPGGDTKEKEIGGIYSTSYIRANSSIYEYMQGTSMACPHVSGVAALVLAACGSENYTPDMLRQKLLCSVTPLTALDAANAPVMGAGLLNASAALSADGTPLKVTDLVCKAVSASSCELQWTNPQLDSGGTPCRYTVACTVENITEASFENHARMPVEIPLSTGIGAIVKTLLTGLTPGTKYRMAIRNSDCNCHASEISNIIEFTTRSNSAPFISGQIPAIAMRDVDSETAYYIGNIFSDSDGDVLLYRISAASSRTVTARIIEDSMLIKPMHAGNTTLTLSADDGNTGIGLLQFTVSVAQNHPPVFSGLATDGTLIPFADPMVIHLADHTADPEGDSIRFYAEAENSSIVLTRIDGSVLTIEPQSHGSAIVHITATDQYAAKADTEINITVEQKYSQGETGKLLLYPNPAGSVLWCSYITVEESTTVNMRIISMSGQLMLQTATENLTPGTHHRSMNISTFSSGTYFVQLIINGMIANTEKMMKL